MKTMFIFSLLLGSSLLSACEPQTATAKSAPESYGQPPNIILMIGDGMGNAAITAHRYYSVEKGIKSTSLDDMLTGSVATLPDDETVVTDSAASATAYATGSKTRNRMLAMAPNGTPLNTLLEQAKRSGYSTGIVTTVPVTHATPAAFYAHATDRSHGEVIADQFVDNRVAGQFTVDLALGGGLKHFQRRDRDVLSELGEAGYQVAESFEQLNTLTQLPAIGVFAASGLPFAIDEPVSRKYRLRDMTNKALTLFSEQQRPFVVMIEGGQIDWCGHDNDIACMMAEMEDFDSAVAIAKAYVNSHPNTLLVVTADHSTGGLSVGGEDTKLWKPEVVAKVNSSVELLANRLQFAPKSELDEIWLTGAGFSLHLNERMRLISLLQASAMEDITKPLEAVVRGIINERSYTGWTTLSHSADDVPLYAIGKGAANFRGHMDNTDVGNALMTLIENR